MTSTGSPPPGGDAAYEVRDAVRRVIDSYTLTMVGPDSQEYVDACVDDVLAVLASDAPYADVPPGSYVTEDPDYGEVIRKGEPVVCAQCQVPMRMLGNNPFHYGCRSCGATHLYADPADPPPAIARLRRVLAEAESRQYGDEVLTFDGFEDTPDAPLLLSDIAALLALVDGVR